MSDLQLIGGGFFMLYSFVLVTAYRQIALEEGDIDIRYVDPMPPVKLLRSKLDESGRSLWSFVTIGRFPSMFIGAVGSVIGPFFAAHVDLHPASGVPLSLAMASAISVYTYQAISVDLGLMQAQWGSWLMFTRPPRSSNDL